MSKVNRNKKYILNSLNVSNKYQNMTGYFDDIIAKNIFLV